MEKLPAYKYVVAFALVLLAQLLAIQFNIDWLRYSSKCLLMPVLVAWVIASKIVTGGRTLILAGLIFSWLGDTFLLFEQRNALFFVFGLASFLITHVFYIVYFLSIGEASNSLLKKNPLYILLVLAYGLLLVWLLMPHLGSLKIPVIIYAAVICTMLLCSIHIYPVVGRPANQYMFSGAALFVLSDSILAVNKFYQPLPLAGILVMVSYGAAQWLIVAGYIRRGQQLSTVI